MGEITSYLVRKNKSARSFFRNKEQIINVNLIIYDWKIGYFTETIKILFSFVVWIN